MTGPRTAAAWPGKDLPGRRLFVAVPLPSDADRRDRRRSSTRVRAAGVPGRRPRRPLGPARRPAPDAPVPRADASTTGSSRRSRRSARGAPRSRRSTSSSAGRARSRRTAGRGPCGSASRDGAASARGGRARRPTARSSSAGWPPETRPFRPHLTLARSDGVAGRRGDRARGSSRRPTDLRRPRAGRPDRAVREPDRRRPGALRAAASSTSADRARLTTGCAAVVARARLASPVPARLRVASRAGRRRVVMAPVGSPADEVRPRRVADPARLVQHRRRPPGAAVAAAPPGHAPAARPGRPGAALPDGAHRPGGLGRARDRDPRAGPRRLPPVPAEPALPRASPRAGARYAGPHLLQVRGRAARPAATSRTRRSRRRSTTRRRASSGSRPRPAPGSGGAPWPSPAPSSASRSRSTWSAPATTRSRTAGSSWRPTARRSWPARRSTTNYGRSVLAETPDSPGSLGMAISEAVEDAATRDDTKYALGSVLNHVLLHQTVIGQEAIEQMGMAGESPDVVIGCTGGGSNFAGLTFPFLGRNFRDGAKHRIIAVEPEAAPSLTRGVYAYDFGDTGKMAPDRQDAHARLTTSSPSRSTPAACATTACRRWSACSRSTASSRRAASTSGASFEAGVAVRPGRGHPAGARADPRDPASPSTRRSRPRRPARPGSSCSTCAATATSTCPPTSATSPATSRTTSTRSRRSRPRWPALPEV